ncbi:SIT4 phosphatase-associated protein-domain-containing protein [Baffinella frigidus]|nr:SIT4 phosphatase-associated protein-domain-containing protein [Cryptophyta sp. CCMP2293]
MVRHCTTASRWTGNTDMMPVISEILDRLGDLVHVLRVPPPMPVIVNTTGTLDPPLGSNRLKILEVMHLLIGLKNSEVDKVMIELGVLPTCLDLFFKYEWHNFLHNLVKKVVEIVVKGENEELQRTLFSGEAKLLERIMDAHHRNEEECKQAKATRKGYMGQLREMANMVVSESVAEREEEGAASNPGAAMMRAALDTEEWRAFVALFLKPLNEMHDKLIGRPQPGGVYSDDEEDMSPGPGGGGGAGGRGGGGGGGGGGRARRWASSSGAPTTMTICLARTILTTMIATTRRKRTR